ncbi:MAG: NAD(P)-dependent oxidoreductase [Pseudomonadota bacterium]
MRNLQEPVETSPLRILVTGQRGFVGRHVCSALNERPDINVITTQPGQFDILDRNGRAGLIDFARADMLIHLAWYTEHGKFWGADVNADWQAASSDLFSRFYDAGGRRVVGIGSCAEYDWQTGADRFRENAPTAPHTAYGAAKVRTSEALSELSSDHAWGRVFFTYGNGEPITKLIPAALSAARHQEPMGIGPAATTRDFMDVRDLGAAIAALALSGAQGAVNVATGTATKFSDLAATIEKIGGSNNIILPDSRELSPGEPASIVADTSRLKSEIGFEPKIGLEAGLRAYFDSF